jgi:hypothetical protein
VIKLLTAGTATPPVLANVRFAPEAAAHELISFLYLLIGQH